MPHTSNHVIAKQVYMRFYQGMRLEGEPGFLPVGKEEKVPPLGVDSKERCTPEASSEGARGGNLGTCC